MPLIPQTVLEISWKVFNQGLKVKTTDLWVFSQNQVFVGKVSDSAHLKKKHNALQVFTFAGVKSVCSLGWGSEN